MILRADRAKFEKLVELSMILGFLSKDVSRLYAILFFALLLILLHSLCRFSCTERCFYFLLLFCVQTATVLALYNYKALDASELSLVKVANSIRILLSLF